MFFEYKSNTLKKLADELAEQVSTLRRYSPFQKIWVVVQNKEVQQWLTLQIAKKSGIAFNFEFVLPSELIWKLYRLEHPDLPKKLPSDRVIVQWQIFELIESKGEEIGLPFISESQKNRFQIAGQIADVFDLYQVFRPEILNVWEKGKLSTFNKSEIWQSKIWNQLNLNWKKKYPDIPSRKEAHFELLDTLTSGNYKKKLYPDSVFIFGLSHTSSPFLNIITSFSSIIDIHFFTVSFEAKNEKVKELIKDWGGNKLDSISLLSGLKESKSISTSSVILSSDQASSLLSKLVIDSDAKQRIEIHSCHNPKREIEVLKDYLLTNLDEDKELLPEEVLVLVSDMDEYAEVIEAVFKEGDKELQIPVYFPNNPQDAYKDCFVTLLELIESRFKINEVLEYLEKKAIRESFRLSEEELFILRKWMSENSIHWGLELSDSSYSLEKANANFMTGFAMEIDGFEVFGKSIPFKGINSSDHAYLMAKISSFIENLKTIRTLSTSKQTLGDWLRISNNWLYTLFNVDEPESINLIKILRNLIEYTDLNTSKTEVEFSLFKEWLVGQLTEKKASSSGYGHGIVLSSYIPYRSIPFKKVCILGFNEGEFPRKLARPAFDLINAYPRPGDRIQKEEDKFLFLEILNSTSESLFISYIGQDQYNDYEKQPSILAQKLMDVFDISKPIKHKLHGFNKDYFLLPKSYSKKKKRIADEVYSANKESLIFYDQKIDSQKEIDETIIEINDLISFFSNSSKYLLSNRLLISERFENSDPEDREVFTVSALSKYRLDQLLMSGLQSKKDSKTIQEYSLISGFIPEGIPGEQAFKKEFRDVYELFDFARAHMQGDEFKGDLEVEVGGVRVMGSFDGVYENRRVFVKAATIKAKDLIQCWILHLALSLSEHDINKTFIIGRDSYKKNQVYSFDDIDNPEAILAKLLTWFITANKLKSSGAFFPESSKAFLEATLSSKEKDPIKEAQKEWLGSEYKRGEGTDFYNTLFWRGETPLETNDFAENASIFWKPLLNHLTLLNDE